MEDSRIGRRMPAPVAVPPGYPRPFGAYVLLAPLAQGGMGEVFLATSSGIAGAVRLVVVKTLRADLAAEPGYVQRFLDEARIVIQLHHVNLTQVFDVGVQDGVHFIAMEYVAGVNLRRLTDACGNAVPAPLALFVVAEALEGLDAAHRHAHPLTGEPLHVVHRDVSPQNVMIGWDGVVKVIDFGLADSAQKLEHTGNDVVLGKIAYMSPEQSRGEKVAAASDQFSAGVVLYELLTGARYYGARGQRDIWLVAGTDDFVPEHLAALDPVLRDIVERAAARRPELRFPSCAEFAAALRAVLRDRYPGTERRDLRAFLREHLDGERQSSELAIRTLAPAALSAITSLTGTSLTGVPSTPPPSSPHPAPDTEPTQTSQLLRDAGVRRKRATLVAAAAAVLVVVAALVVARTWSREPAPAATLASAAPLPPAPAPGSARAAAVTSSSVAPAPGSTTPLAVARGLGSAHAAATTAPPSPAPAFGGGGRGVGGRNEAATATHAATSTTAAKGGAATAAGAHDAAASGRTGAKKSGAPAAKRGGLPDGWRAWPMERKVKALERSPQPCARTLLKLRAGGTELQPGAVDVCLASG